MSKFRKLVEAILTEYNYRDDSQDHTGDDSVDYTIRFPATEELRNLIVSENLADLNEMQEITDNWTEDWEQDVIIDYTISGYPYDEELEILAVYLPTYESVMKNARNPSSNLQPGKEITSLLPKEVLDKLPEDLEENGKVNLHYIDDEKEWRDDYYRSVL